MSADEVMKVENVYSDASVILQGVVDCWFEENGEIVVVDYKTGENKQRIEEYRQQLGWYSKALQKLTGLPVKERIIWYLNSATSFVF
jgi:ATP-dependent helicase/nuclease subunit A